jgi:uncharacterized protein GlcG (DUF336 family)
MGTIFQIGCVSAESAPKMIEGAVARANSIGVPQVVAILDESGLLKGFCRMDGAPLISIEVAQNKAYTALLGTPSQDCFNQIKDDPALLAGVPHIPRIVTSGGGGRLRISCGLWTNGKLLRKESTDMLCNFRFGCTETLRRCTVNVPFTHSLCFVEICPIHGPDINVCPAGKPEPNGCLLKGVQTKRSEPN